MTDRYQGPAGTRPISWIPDIAVPAQRYDIPTYDRHIRRSGDDYSIAYSQLLPQGQAWPTWDATSNLMSWVSGTSQIWGDVDGRAADLLERESDPRSTLDLLPDWERAFGLPDPCVAEPLTISGRQTSLVARITMAGDQSRQFFLNLADFYEMKISVIEHAPYMGGISCGGDTTFLTESGGSRWEAGAETIRYYWTIGVAKPRLTWFRGGAGQGGIDHHLEIGLTTDMQCLFERLKPAHVELVWQLHLETLNPMEGTP